MTGTLKFYDAAWPPSPPPAGMDGVCAYIGGDTPHVWTRAEIDAQPARYRLPVWVRSDPQAVNPLADAAACLAALRAIGAPGGSLVALDSETSIDPAWVHAFVEAVNQGGYRVIDYGSQSTVFGNRNPDGYYWGADWTGQPHIHAGDVMTQWVSFATVDESVAQSGLPFWDTRPAKTWREWTTGGELSLAAFAAAAGFEPMTFLRVQVQHYGAFNGGLYDYGNAVLAGKLPASAPMPAGIKLWTLA